MRRKLIAVQLVLVIICVAVTWAIRGSDFAMAAAYGGLVAIISAWLLSSRVERAGELAKRNVKWSVYSLLFGAVQRFVFVLAALALGMWEGAFGLEAVPLLISFAVAQLAYMIAMGRHAASL